MSIEQMEFLKDPETWDKRIYKYTKEILKEKGVSEEEINTFFEDNEFITKSAEIAEWRKKLAQSDSPEETEKDLAKGLAYRIMQLIIQQDEN